MVNLALLERLATTKPGDVLIVVRTGIAGYVDARFEVTIERTTPTRLYVSKNGYIEKKTGKMKPRYLTYTTTVESVREAETL